MSSVILIPPLVLALQSADRLPRSVSPRGATMRSVPLLLSLLSVVACAGPGAERPASTTDVAVARELQCAPLSLAEAEADEPDGPLEAPMALERDQRLQGNPLATYAAMREMESQYLASPVFRQIYPEVRLNLEQFFGLPCAGLQAMRLLGTSAGRDSVRIADLNTYVARPAIDVIRERASGTRLVIYGEEHHLPQTRSVFEQMLHALSEEGYGYLAAEAFEDADMTAFDDLDYGAGYYLLDPVFASAIRTARKLGYTLVSYDTRERGPDPSFRDTRQAENIVARIFDRDPEAKVLVLAGRGHASEAVASDGWTPMAHVLKGLTGIDPLTLYAPTMTERLSTEEENPLYRHATARGWISEPMIFEHPHRGDLFGTAAFDAYVFFPRTRLIGDRPDWMVTTLRRTPVLPPAELLLGNEVRLVQAFGPGIHVTAIPQDQVLVNDPSAPPVLMLPPGVFRVRSVDRAGNELAWAVVEIP